jgi:hypothetical protein
VPLAQLSLLAGQEHGWTIPLPELGCTEPATRSRICAAPHPPCARPRIAGQRYADDYQVRWRRLAGRQDHARCRRAARPTAMVMAVSSSRPAARLDANEIDAEARAALRAEIEGGN